MEQNIRLDVNHMMADMLGSEYGVTQEQLAAMKDAAVKAQHNVEANRGTGWLGWMNLPYNQEEIVAQIEKTAEHVRKTFKYFVVLGIGGSALGPIAVHQALNHLHYNELPDSKRPGPKFYVEDNIDPERMAALLDVIELDKACFCIISKSGGTAETMSQYLIVTEALKAQVGADWAKHVIAVTDHEKGNLIKLAKENGFATVRLPSGEMRKLPLNAKATIGTVGNTDHENVRLGKAGRVRHMGVRPTVRGVVMNPNDHPHGGGEGKSPVGLPAPVTPWGKPALGLKTRKHKKYSNKMIVKRAGK